MCHHKYLYECKTNSLHCFVFWLPYVSSLIFVFFYYLTFIFSFVFSCVSSSIGLGRWWRKKKWNKRSQIINKDTYIVRNTSVWMSNRYNLLINSMLLLSKELFITKEDLWERRKWLICECICEWEINRR